MASKGWENSLKIYVAPLPADTTRQELIDYFSQFGMITEIHMKKKYSHQSSRILSDSTCMIKAGCLDVANRILGCHHFFKRRVIQCSRFKEGHELERSNQESNRSRVVVKNVPQHTSKEYLREIIAQFGTIVYFFFLNEDNPDINTNKKKCKTAQVHFKEVDAAQRLLQKKSLRLCSKVKIKFKPYDPKQKRQRNSLMSHSITSRTPPSVSRDARPKNPEQSLPRRCSTTSMENFQLVNHFLKPSSQEYYKRLLPVETLKSLNIDGTENLRFNISVRPFAVASFYATDLN